MQFNLTARRLYLVPALGLTLFSAVTLSACSSSAASSAASALPSSVPTSGIPTSLPSGIPTSLPSGIPTSLDPDSSSAPAGASGGGSGTAGQITTNWNKFFNSSTSNSDRVKLLQNGTQFASAISSFSSSPFAAAVSSKVDSVSVTSATKAKVTYDLTALGATVAKGSTGSSVLQDGTWKVGDDVFCGLLKEAKGAGMSVTVPSACSSAA
jgi:hypothetical protein